MVKLSASSFIIITTLLLSVEAYAAKNPVSIVNLKSNAQKIQRQVDSLAKKITSLEKELGQKHGEYLTTIKIRQELEAKLIGAEHALQNGKQEAHERIEKLRTVLKRLALQELDHNQHAATMAARELLTKQVKIQLTSLHAVAKQAEIKGEELKQLRGRIQDYIEVEHRLSQLVQSMEERKKDSANAYIEAISEKSVVEEKLSALKLVKRIDRSAQMGVATRFSSPVDDFLGIEYDKKGITYKFNGRRPVLAADTGKVAYSGRLSTYGNVVLIDHGEETRSVVLGQFVPKLKKGQNVSRGDVIGYTDNSITQGKVYFEIRKGDKVLDTIALMDKDFLKKHRITKI